jgi:hypothetical protein
MLGEGVGGPSAGPDPSGGGQEGGEARVIGSDGVTSEPVVTVGSRVTIGVRVRVPAPAPALTTVVEVEIQDDGSMVMLAERDWRPTLLDAASIELLGAVADEATTWDVYRVRHRDGSERTYALPVT